MILIAGDSWGCGEWNSDGEQYRVTHSGLQQYLEDNNQLVINLCRGGNSPGRIANDVNLFFSNGAAYHLVEPITTVLIFQTEWCRDLRYITNTINPDDALSAWYSNLSSIATNVRLTFHLIGGISDIIYIPDFETKYPGLKIACQSFVNLCINDDHRVSDPTYTVRPSDNVLKKLEETARKNNQLELLTTLLDSGSIRGKLLTNNPQWFFPDGGHANRRGHKKLFEFLKDTHVV